MKRFRSVVLGACVAGASLLTTLSVIGLAQIPEMPARKAVVDAEHKRLQPQDGLSTMIVFGDPSKPGMYVIRNRFEPGRMSHPHYHDQARYVTVIKGTWWTGEGDVFDPAKTTPIGTGGFMYHPAGFHHYDGAKDEEVVVQIMGMGPVKTVQTEKKTN